MKSSVEIPDITPHPDSAENDNFGTRHQCFGCLNSCKTISKCRFVTSAQAFRVAAISHIQNLLCVSQLRSLRVFQGNVSLKTVLAQSSPRCPWSFGSPSIQYLHKIQPLLKQKCKKTMHLFWHNSYLFSVSITLLTQTHWPSVAMSLRPSQNASPWADML